MVKLASSFLLKIVICIFFACFVFSKQTTAQNFFANPGFEDINVCTEFNAFCAPEAWFYIRPTTNPLVNRSDVPIPLSGQNLLLVPMENVYCRKDFEASFCHGFVYTMLACPLLKDETYHIEFYVNSSGRKYHEINFAFSSIEPAIENFDVYRPPGIISIRATDLRKDTVNGWRKVTHDFTATGKEKYFILGNFSKSQLGFKKQERMNSGGMVYYFVDDISLTSNNGISLCQNYQVNIEKIYAQNFRHTNYMLVGDQLSEAVQEITKPIVFRNDTITIPAAFFKTGSAALMPSFNRLMDSIITTLDGKKIAKIEVVGHTDNRGSLLQNEQLSLARSQSVQSYLIHQRIQYEQIIFTSGKGPAQPVDDNNTEKGRAKNRRVEIVLTFIESVPEK